MEKITHEDYGKRFGSFEQLKSIPIWKRYFTCEMEEFDLEAFFMHL